jgi:hypothetical protein
MLVSVIQGASPRARVICDAWQVGLSTPGINVNVKRISEQFYHGPDSDVAVFYGLFGRLRDAFVEYRRVGKKAIYVDLGYWDRVRGGKLSGYHKVSVNARHPTAYFQNRPFPHDRRRNLGIKIEPWKKGGKHILIAGMGAKAAAVEGFKPNQWEEAAVRELRKHTERDIIYRPKPSWNAPTQIPGTIYSPREQPLEEVLKDCHATVSHHSNVCVDGLVAGIPAFCFHGVASVMGPQDLSKIETPHYPDDREQWADNIAYTQWTPNEMALGMVWRHLLHEGIIG